MFGTIEEYLQAMKRLNDVALEAPQREALSALQSTLRREFPIQTLVLYGSGVRGEADAESDLDLLVVTGRPLSRWERHQITDVVFEINLRLDTNLSTLVVDSTAWETGPLSVLPLRDEILREGVTL
jgi:predicted nucleotidyltransferase